CWNNLTFNSAGVESNFDSLVVKPLRDFCGRSMDAAAIGEGYLPGLLKSVVGTSLGLPDISQHVETHYEVLFKGKVTLQEIPDRPRFIFNATNFCTGVDFRFSKPYAGDYRIGYIPNPQFSVAFAVTCSSAFPPLSSPVVRSQDPDAFKAW